MVRRATTRLLAALNARPDQGSLAPFVAIIMVALLSGVGLLYDGAQKVSAARDATALAAEAARAAGQEISGDAILGQTSTVDPSQGVIAANTFLAATGTAGSVSIQGSQVVVTTQRSWTPRFIGLFGAGTQTETGTATVSTKRVLGGTEQ